jgi:hypothetical protein
MHHVVALEILEDGRIVPLVDHDYTKPLEGMSRQVRRQWERRYWDFRRQYDMPADLAWYRATVAVTGRGD